MFHILINNTWTAVFTKKDIKLNDEVHRTYIKNFMAIFAKYMFCLSPTVFIYVQKLYNAHFFYYDWLIGVFNYEKWLCYLLRGMNIIITTCMTPAQVTYMYLIFDFPWIAFSFSRHDIAEIFPPPPISHRHVKTRYFFRFKTNS
jgi:hypothetical protein